jgi:hypothetical protein
MNIFGTMGNTHLKSMSHLTFTFITFMVLFFEACIFNIVI